MNFFIPDPLVQVSQDFDDEDDFDNVYTKYYKYAHLRKSPVSTVVLLQSDNGNEYFQTYAEIIDQDFSTRSPDEYGIRLVEVDKMITSRGNTVRKSEFIYDFCRVVFQIGLRQNISIESISIVIIQSMTYYAEAFSTFFVIRTMDDLTSWLLERKKRYRYDVLLDTKRYYDIMNVQTKIFEIGDYANWFESSDQTTLNKTFKLIPKMLSGEPIRAEIGDFIFDNMDLSERVPYANYNDNIENSYTKIYTGLDFNNEPNYNKMMIESKRGNKEDTIEFTIWLGTGTIYKTSSESFFRVVYNLSENTIIYSVPITLRSKEMGYEISAYRHIKNAFSKILDVGIPEVIQSKIEFNLYPLRNSLGKMDPEHGDFTFEEFVFLHHFSLNETYRNIISIDESVMPYPRRSRYEFLYNDMFARDFISTDESITWSLTLKQMSREISYSGPNNAKITNREGVYLRIRIYNARNQKAINDMISVLIPLLCIYYRDVSLRPDDTDRIQYINILKNLEKIEENMRAEKLIGKNEISDKKINREGGLRLKEYEKKYPKIFIESYTKACPSHKTPIIFQTEDEAKIWSIKNSRSYIQYPASNPMFWFSAPHPDYKFPSIIANRDRSTMDTIPYFPCTSKTDLTKENIDSDYNEFYRGKTRSFLPSAIILKTDKFLKTEELGEIPSDILMYLSDANPNLMKKGIADYPSPNSFLHCVLYAIKDTEYMSLYRQRVLRGRKQVREWNQRREEYVISTRKKLATSFFPPLLKQELHDIRDYNQIVQRVLDTDSFFDPSIFYRIIEEVYRVNIFVFNAEGYEIPRHRMFSVRHVRTNRPSILIFKNKGPRISKHLEKYEGCELIFDRKENITYFDEEITELCRDLHTSMMTTITMSRKAGYIASYSNKYYFLDYVDIFGNAIVAQHIDGYGKVMALNVKFENEIMTVYVPPGQPLNLPSTMHRIVSRIDLALNHLEMTGKSGVFYVTRDVLGNINGIWFSVLDISACFYVQVAGPSEKIAQLQMKAEGPQVIPFGYSMSDISVYREQERMVSIIQQLVTWIFSHARKQDYLELDEQFIDAFFRVTPSPPKTSVGYYDITNLRQILPDTESVYDAMNHVNYYTKNLVGTDNTGKFIFTFHNKIFRDRMADYLRKHFRESFLAGKPRIKLLQNFRSSHISFIQKKGIEVFVSAKEFHLWLQGRNQSKKTENKIYKSVKISYGKRINPYIYLDPTGKLYLIQNIQGVVYPSAEVKLTGEMLLLTTIHVARTWRDKGINLGYETFYDEIYKDFKYEDRIVTYGVSKSGILIPINDTKGKPNYISVLQYASKQDINVGKYRYAAMLPLDK